MRLINFGITLFMTVLCMISTILLLKFATGLLIYLAVATGIGTIMGIIFTMLWIFELVGIKKGVK
ncbi:hypothetical protein [Lactococcus lactis]|uniref:hypothetical protein n=1 Tax=Lactococcus lactis TaxID=1358 RepID=UPI0018C821C8|nr:hypothetical protein [Lactococcus lactis]MBG1279286.1 hypothetical protein [Lactococcus lactis subsp. lactis]